MTSNENGVGLKESGRYSASEAMNARKFRFKDKKDDAIYEAPNRSSFHLKRGREDQLLSRSAESRGCAMAPKPKSNDFKV
jgi:hypothetical protein